MTRFMRIPIDRLSVWPFYRAIKRCVFCALLCCLPVSASADVSHCHALFAVMPQTLDGHDVEERKDLEHENPGLGFVVRYSKNSVGWPTFIFFDGQMNVVDQATKHAYFQASIEDLRQAAQMRGESIHDVQTQTIDQAKPFVELIAFATTQKVAGDTSEVLSFGQIGECMVKIRYTSLLDRAATLEAFNGLLNAYVGTLSALKQ